MQDAQALAYVRPHEIEVLASAHSDALPAQLRHMTVVGHRIRLELQTANSTALIKVELPKEQFRRLGLLQGDRAWLRPLHSKLFLEQSLA